ncbi:MAG: hypothetical protein OEZ06_32150, partial [Myxococcales bacterium]|nr:hypothetical protein [Myxococcales bacterium]
PAHIFDLHRFPLKWRATCVKNQRNRGTCVAFGITAAVETKIADEAWLALTLLSLTLFHGLSMTPLWENFAPGGQSLLKWMALTLGTPRLLNFTIAMAALILLPIALYALACFIAARWAGDGTRPGRLFQAYAMSLLPVALAYHLAHNAMHILMEGGAIVPLLSDPLGDGSNHFGTASMHVGSLVSDSVLWTLQVLLILIGHVFGLAVAHRIGHRLHASPKAARRSLIPIPAVMVAISLCGLWLMHLDMNMRVGRMRHAGALPPRPLSQAALPGRTLRGVL